VKKVIGIAVAAAALAACGGGKKPEMSNQILHANGPDWVNRGSGAFGGEKGKIFYGVGIASGIRNASLRRNTADARARSEIAKTLDTYIAVLNKDYQASTTAGDMSASTEEQHVQQALKTYTQAQLSGTLIVDHWVDNDGTEYALAQLDMEAFKDSLDKMKELNARVREAVRANADKAFDELAAEEAKRQ
jgi:LPP20 lipoprotein